MSKQELEPTQGSDLEVISDAEQALIDANQADTDLTDIQVPILKIGQPLTREVVEGDADAGSFINALTGEDLGDEIEFIVAGFQKGRFMADDNDRAYVAYGPVVPDSWRDDKHIGEPFSEHPDAEEKYKERVNAGEIEWGKGPPISTTYNFTGFVADTGVPVRLSLMRTQVPVAKKWVTILNAVLRGRYWDNAFVLTTQREQAKKGTFYKLNVKQGRKTTAEERARAVELATVVRDQRVAVVGEDALNDGNGTGNAVPAAAEGALDV